MLSTLPTSVNSIKARARAARSSASAASAARRAARPAGRARGRKLPHCLADPARGDDRQRQQPLEQQAVVHGEREEFADRAEVDDVHALAAGRVGHDQVDAAAIRRPDAVNGAAMPQSRNVPCGRATAPGLRVMSATAVPSPLRRAICQTALNDGPLPEPASAAARASRGRAGPLSRPGSPAAA